jgi:hypothetical protein
MTINPLDLLTAAVDRKIIQVFWLNPIEIVENLWFHPAKTRAIGINSAFTGRLIKIDAPAIVSDQTEVVIHLIGREILIQFWAIDWI